MFNFLTSTHAHGVWDIGILEFGVQLPCPYILFSPSMWLKNLNVLVALVTWWKKVIPQKLYLSKGYILVKN